MNLKLKLSILMVAITVVVVGAIAFSQERKAREMILDAVLEGLEFAAAEQAEYWQGHQNDFIKMLRTIAEIMAGYENIEPDIRRDLFDNMLRNAAISEPALLQIYSVWKPNALDGMDSKYIDRLGSTDKGQYATIFTRENGNIESRATGDVQGSMEYFNGPNSKKDRILDPFHRVVLNKDAYLIRTMVPIINPRTNEVVGGVGSLWNISAVQEKVSKIINEKKDKDISYISIYASNGFIMGNHQPDRVGKTLKEADADYYGSEIDNVSKAIKNGEKFETNQYVPRLKSNVYTFLQPVKVGNSDENWSVMIGIDEDRILKRAKEATEFTIIMAIIAIIAATIIIYFVLAGATAPISKITSKIEDISEGEGDLTRTLTVYSKDEVGDLARHFNTLMEALRVPIKETKSVVDSLACASEELSSVSAMLSESSEKTVSRTVSVAKTTEDMSVNISAMASGAEEASVNANEVAGAAEEMSANMSTIAATIEQMSASISQIASNASEARNVAGTASQKSSDATNVMNKLGDAAKEIGQVTDVIKRIADKTNLLALNATIEAASAGEAGKGFAVVASEIKELAMQSAKSADDIANRIEGIQSETNDAVFVIHDVSNIITQINQSVEAIAGHVEQQTKASNEIASNVAQANTGAKRVASAISEVAKGVNDVSHNASRAAIGARDVSEHVASVSSVANESSLEVSRVKSSASNLSEMANRLNLVMGKFKV